MANKTITCPECQREVPLDLGAVEKEIQRHWFIDPKRDMDKLKGKNKEAHRRAMVLLDAVKGGK